MRAWSNRGLVATVLLTAIVSTASMLPAMPAIVSPLALQPASAAQRQLECWVLAHDGDFEIGWSGAGSAELDRFVVERRSYGIYRHRATVGRGARSFADGPSHRTISADYRVSMVDRAGTAISTTECTPSNSPGLTCRAVPTSGGYRVSWSGPVWDEAQPGAHLDVVVRRRVRDGDPLWWRGRVANASSFDDGRSPTSSARYVIEVRNEQRVSAMAACGVADADLRPDSCEPLAVSQETGGSTGLTVGPDGRVYHLGRLGDEPVLQVLGRDGVAWTTLARTALYARSFFTVGSDLYYIENDETGGRVQHIDVATGTVHTVLAKARIDLALLVASDETVYLRADDGVTGDDLWRFDPTTGRSDLVIDLNGTNPSRPARVVETADGSIYFTGFNGSTSRELFRYHPDGNPFQVVELDNVAPEGLQPLTDRSGALYLSETGVGLSRLDPDTGETELVIELHDEAQKADVVAVGPDGRLYISVRSGDGRRGERRDGRLVIYEPGNGRVIHPPFNSGGVILDIEFASASRFVVTSQVDGDRIEIIDLDTWTSSAAPVDDLPRFIWSVATPSSGSAYFTGSANVYTLDSRCS